MAATYDAQPPRKKIRRTASSTSAQKQRAEPRLFVPFRALGLVTNHVPFVLQTRSYKGATDGPRVHILTCLGKSWALWEGGKMTLLFVGASELCMSAESCSYMFNRTGHGRSNILLGNGW